MGSQLIKKQFAVTRKNILSLLEGVSPEVLDVVPEGFNNNIHWQIGHILTAGELFLFNGQKIYQKTTANTLQVGQNQLIGQMMCLQLKIF